MMQYVLTWDPPNLVFSSISLNLDFLASLLMPSFMWGNFGGLYGIFERFSGLASFLIRMNLTHHS